MEIKNADVSNSQLNLKLIPSDELFMWQRILYYLDQEDWKENYLFIFYIGVFLLNWSQIWIKLLNVKIRHEIETLAVVILMSLYNLQREWNGT